MGNDSREAEVSQFSIPGMEASSSGGYGPELGSVAYLTDEKSVRESIANGESGLVDKALVLMSRYKQ